MKGAYYNEFDAQAAEWLRTLIMFGHIAPGDVDDRSIKDVSADDLSGYSQHHFFAGIGVWSLALRNAGWDDDRPVWTGSCPCQPFSAAGKGGGFDDARHLWPDFFRLIGECGPDVVLGEQVASKDGLAWLDLVSTDLEGAGYAVGSVDTCAAGFGAPHIRQRLYWTGTRLEHTEGVRRLERWSEPGGRGVERGRSDIGMADTDDKGLEGRIEERQRTGERPVGPGGVAGGLGDADSVGEGTVGRLQEGSGAERQGDVLSEGRGGMANADSYGAGDGPRQGVGEEAASDSRDGRVSGERLRVGIEGASRGLADAAIIGRERGRTGEAGDEPGTLERPERLRDADRPGPTNGLWRDADWLFCRDGKWRPVKPGTFPLAHGWSQGSRVALLRGAGNAINEAQARGFIEAVMEAL